MFLAYKGAIYRILKSKCEKDQMKRITRQELEGVYSKGIFGSLFKIQKCLKDIIYGESPPNSKLEARFDKLFNWNSRLHHNTHACASISRTEYCLESYQSIFTFQNPLYFKHGPLKLI